ncbi:MAG: heavy metal-binding domain-containing protein [Thermoproteota archaeon]
MSTISDFLMVTTLPGYKVKKVLGLASGLTARTRGFGGKFVGGFQSLAGGEVTAFTVEMDKAWVEALQRLRRMVPVLGRTLLLTWTRKQQKSFREQCLPRQPVLQ